MFRFVSGVSEEAARRQIFVSPPKSGTVQDALGEEDEQEQALGDTRKAL
jgi:hypothetical protein